MGTFRDLTEHSLDGSIVYSGKLLEVHRDDVSLPDGTRGGREWINHPGAAAVLPFFDDESVLLVRQFRFPPRREFLEVPAGKLDRPGEDPAAVALRELEEETGWTATDLRHLVAAYPCIGYSNEVIHFYMASGLVPGRRSLSEGEFLEAVRLPFSDVVARVSDGRIDDMKTIAAVLLANLQLKRSNTDR